MSDYIPYNNEGGLSKYKITDQRHMPLLLINGQLPPSNFRYGYTESTEQLVRSQRNSQGVIVSEMIGDRLLKFDNLEWPILNSTEYKWLQRQVAQFFAYVTYYDMRANTGTGGFVTKKFYWGDFNAEPFKFERDTDNGLLVPSYYINVKVNLIDCGEPYIRPGQSNYCSPRKFGPPYGATNATYGSNNNNGNDNNHDPIQL